MCRRFKVFAPLVTSKKPSNKISYFIDSGDKLYLVETGEYIVKSNYIGESIPKFLNRKMSYALQTSDGYWVWCSSYKPIN